MSEGHPFTEADDHLAEFIATNNSGLSGRNGNITLVESRSGYNARILSTSSYSLIAKAPGPRLEEDEIGHTKKLAEEEERGMPKERSGNYMHELFSSFVEDEDGDFTMPKNPPARSALISPATERVYPDVRNVPLPDFAKEPHMPDPFEITSSVRPLQDLTPFKSETNTSHPSPLPVHPAVPLQGEKRVLKRKIPANYPFIDNTPPPLSPTPERHPTKRKAPPVLNEGPFRNIFLQTQNHVFGRKTQQQLEVNAIASSSRVKLLPSTVLQPDDPFLTGIALQEAQQPVSIRNGAALSHTQADTAKRLETNERSWAFVTEQKRQEFGHPTVAQRESTHTTLASVPASSSATQGNTRVNNKRSATRHIDLRETLKGRRPRSGESSLVSSHGSTIWNPNSISYHTIRHNSAASFASHNYQQRASNEGDSELFSLLERDLSELGEQYGFSLRIVKQTYLQFGTLEKTVVVLRALNAIMKGAQDKLYEEMQCLGNKQDHDTTDECDSIPQGVILKAISSGEKDKEMGESHGVSSNKRHRWSLNYKPLTTDVEDQSEYSPPSRTRAGRYTKLQKEGREEEALIAASGDRLAFHLRRDADEKESLRRATTIMGPSSPLDLGREHSSTPDEEGSVGLRESEGEEEGRYDGEDDEVVKDDGVEDECEVHEPTPEVGRADDKELGLKAELRKLCSEVTLGNQNIFTAFEKRDLLGRGSGDWIVQMFSSLKETQKIRRQEYYRKRAKGAHEPASPEV